MAWMWYARWATLVECSPTPVSECSRTHRKLLFQKSGLYRLPRAACISAYQRIFCRIKSDFVACTLVIDYLSIPTWPYGPVLPSRRTRDILYCNLGSGCPKLYVMIRRIINKMSLENAQNRIQNLVSSNLMSWISSPGQMLSGTIFGLSRTVVELYWHPTRMGLSTWMGIVRGV